MRPLRNFLLLLAIVLGIQDLRMRKRPDEKRLSITRDVMEEFAHGGVAAVRERFSADLKDSVSASDLKGARKNWPAWRANSRRKFHKLQGRCRARRFMFRRASSNITKSN